MNVSEFVDGLQLDDELFFDEEVELVGSGDFSSVLDWYWGSPLDVQSGMPQLDL